MKNHKKRDPRAEKIKDMEESILPSTYRKSMRERRRTIHRQARRAHRMGKDLDMVERKRSHEIMYMMHDRRNGDKLSVVRWAVEVTKHMETPQERRDYMKSLMPNTLMGNHALQHIFYHENFRVDDFKYGWHYHQRELERKAEREAEIAAVKNAIELTLKTGGLKALNRAIKRSHKVHYIENRYYVNPDGVRCSFLDKDRKLIVERHKGHQVYRRNKYVIEPCDCAPRTLKGAHDVEAFMNDLLGTYDNSPFFRATSRKHPEWAAACKKFLEENS